MTDTILVDGEDEDVMGLVRQLCGDDVATYLQNKHRGGKAGGEGVFYETLYAIFRAALLIRALIDGADDEIHLSTQTLDFVDDFVMCFPAHSSRHHVQLKNTDQVSWGGGAHPISQDFKLQKAINEALGFAVTRTSLVVPTKRKADSLAKRMPADIGAFSNVELFAYGETLNHALQIEPRLYEAIARLCASPDVDKVEKLGSLLIGEWVSKSGSSCSLSTLWNGVKRHEPNYIRDPGAGEISQECHEVLMQIADFTYSIDTGYFVWSFMDTDSGMLDYSVSSGKFAVFQQSITARAPKTFDELEELLV